MQVKLSYTTIIFNTKINFTHKFFNLKISLITVFKFLVKLLVCFWNVMVISVVLTAVVIRHHMLGSVQFWKPAICRWGPLGYSDKEETTSTTILSRSFVSSKNCCLLVTDTLLYMYNKHKRRGHVCVSNCQIRRLDNKLVANAVTIAILYLHLSDVRLKGSYRVKTWCVLNVNRLKCYVYQTHPPKNGESPFCCTTFWPLKRARTTIANAYNYCTL